MIDRLELVLEQISELDRERDAVLEEKAPDKAALMIQELVKLRGIGVQSATVLVHEAFVRKFANGKALGSYASLTATPYSSGGTEREQGIDKAGNRRLRTVMVELAWLWQRYQPNSAQVCWFPKRIAGMGARMRKVMVVALARKLLITLWRFVTLGVLPEGAVLSSDLLRRWLEPIGSGRSIQGGVAVVRHGAKAPSTQSGAIFLELSRPGCGTVVRSDSAGCEVCTGEPCVSVGCAVCSLVSVGSYHRSTNGYREDEARSRPSNGCVGRLGWEKWSATRHSGSGRRRRGIWPANRQVECPRKQLRRLVGGGGVMTMTLPTGLAETVEHVLAVLRTPGGAHRRNPIVNRRLGAVILKAAMPY
jgi:transposase